MMYFCFFHCEFKLIKIWYFNVWDVSPCHLGIYWSSTLSYFFPVRWKAEKVAQLLYVPQNVFLFYVLGTKMTSLKLTSTDDKGLPASDESNEPWSHCDSSERSWTVHHSLCRGTMGWDPQTEQEHLWTAIIKVYCVNWPNCTSFSFHLPSLPGLLCQQIWRRWFPRVTGTRAASRKPQWHQNNFSVPVYCRHGDVCWLWNQVRCLHLKLIWLVAVKYGTLQSLPFVWHRPGKNYGV